VRLGAGLWLLAWGTIGLEKLELEPNEAERQALRKVVPDISTVWKGR